MGTIPLAPLIFAFLGGIFSALQGLSYKFALLNSRPFPCVAILNLTMAIAAIIALYFTQNSTDYSDYRIYIIAVSQGVAFVITVYFLSLASKMGFLGIGWTFLGMSVIAVVGGAAVFLGEALYSTDILSLMVFIIMIMFMQDNDTDKTADIEGVPIKNMRMIKNGICIILFLLNAVILIAYRFKEYYFSGPETNSALMAAVSGLTAAVVGFTIHFITVKKEDLKITKLEWKGGILVGLTLIAIVFCNFPANKLPAAIMFPIIQGISILGGVVLITAFYKEQLSLRKKIGVLLAVVVIILSANRVAIADYISKIL